MPHIGDFCIWLCPFYRYLRLRPADAPAPVEKINKDGIAVLLQPQTADHGRLVIGQKQLPGLLQLDGIIVLHIRTTFAKFAVSILTQNGCAGKNCTGALDKIDY